MKSGCLAIAYETVTDRNGRLPLLTPMSQVAGRMSMQVAAWALMRTKRGRGLLLGGVPGTQQLDRKILSFCSFFTWLVCVISDSGRFSIVF